MLSKEESEQILKPHYHDLLVDCIDPAWDIYKNVFQEYQSFLELRTRAGILRDLIVSKVRIKYFGKPNPRIIENSNGLFMLSFDDIVFARFKKIKTDYTTSNILTQQAIQFNSNELFPEYINKVLVNIGYMVDRDWNRKGTYICCPNGNSSYLWYLDLAANGIFNEKELISLDENDTEEDEDIEVIKGIINPKEEKKTIVKKIKNNK